MVPPPGFVRIAVVVPVGSCDVTQIVIATCAIAKLGSQKTKAAKTNTSIMMVTLAKENHNHNALYARIGSSGRMLARCWHAGIALAYEIVLEGMPLQHVAID